MTDNVIKNKKGVNALVLRLIAYAAMTFGYSTLLTGVHEVDWPTYMLYFSFTIFAFLLIEGIKKTSNKYAYFRRIVLFTVISEIPHDLLICGNWWDVSRQSIMLSILIAFIIVNVADIIKTRLENMIITLAASVVLCYLGGLACELLNCEISYFGMAIVGIMYISSNVTYSRLLQLICFGLIVLYVAADNYFNIIVDGFYYSFPDKSFAMLGAVVTWFYNGKRGPNNLAVRIFYYAYFPIMLLVIWLIKTYA